MAKYTMTLMDLKTNYPETYAALFPAWSIFDNDETHKTNLQNNILNYFALREIGSETPDRFQFYFQRMFLKYVEEYNRLGRAQAEVAQLGWLEEYEETESGENSGKSTGKATSSGTDTENGTTSGTSTGKTTSKKTGSDTDTLKETTSDEKSTTESGTTSGTSTSSGTSSGTKNDTTSQTGNAKAYEYPINGQVSTADYSATSENKTEGSGTNAETTSGETSDSTTTSGETSATGKETNKGTKDITDTQTHSENAEISQTGSTSGTEERTRTTSETNDTTEETTGKHSASRSGRRTAAPELYLKYIDAIKTLDIMWYAWLEPCFFQLF